MKGGGQGQDGRPDRHAAGRKADASKSWVFVQLRDCRTSLADEGSKERGQAGTAWTLRRGRNTGRGPIGWQSWSSPSRRPLGLLCKQRYRLLMWNLGKQHTMHKRWDTMTHGSCLEVVDMLMWFFARCVFRCLLLRSATVA